MHFLHIWKHTHVPTFASNPCFTALHPVAEATHISAYFPNCSVGLLDYSQALGLHQLSEQSIQESSYSAPSLWLGKLHSSRRSKLRIYMFRSECSKGRLSKHGNLETGPFQQLVYLHFQVLVTHKML